MPISVEQIQNYKRDLRPALERRHIEVKRDAEKDGFTPSFRDTAALNSSGKTEEEKYTLAFYMLKSDAVIDILIKADLFKDEEEVQIRNWQKLGKAQNEEVEDLLKNRLSSNLYYKLSQKKPNNSPRSKFTNYLYYLDALSAYVEEFQLMKVEWVGYYDNPEKVGHKSGTFKVSLDLLFDIATLNGIPDEFPDEEYKGAIEYTDDLVQINFNKKKTLNHPNLTVSLHANKDYLIKRKIIKGNISVSIPTTQSRLNTRIFLEKVMGEVVETEEEIQETGNNKIAQFLSLYGEGFNSDTNLKAAETTLFEKSGFPIDLLEDYVGTYFGYQKTEKKELEIFVFRLDHHYRGALQHSSMLKEMAHYHCAITPISTPLTKIEINVQHPKNGNPIFKLYAKVSEVENFENRKIPVVKLHKEYPEGGVVAMKFLCNDPKIKRPYLIAEVKKIEEVNNFQDMAIIRQLLK